MNLLAFNLSWMLFNLILALIPVALTLVLRKKLDKRIYLIVLFLWLLFLPNTIYLVTDLQYFPYQFKISNFFVKLVLILMYTSFIISGITAFMFSLQPFKNLISKNKDLKKIKVLLYIILNFVVAFAVVLGKFQRTHSWYVFTEPLRVISDVYALLDSPTLLLYILYFGITINIVFFATKRYFFKAK